MNFLLIPKWLSSVGESITGAVVQALRTICFSLDTVIYKLIIDLYDMFLSLCNVRLLDSTLIDELSKRIGLVLGIVMLFYVVLSFIQMLVNPESDIINDKEKGAVSIIKRVIVVIVLIGTSSFIFNSLFSIQTTVINSNIISKILLPYQVNIKVNNQDVPQAESLTSNSKFGAILSEELLMGFYEIQKFGDDAELTDDDETTYSSCEDIVNAFRTQIVYYKKFDLGYNCLNESVTVSYKIDESATSDSVETNIIDFNFLLSPVAGVVVAYLIFIYCFKVGVRMVQLMFLEIISPMAFVSYLSPKKDTMFSKWTKIYFSTYIDVFLRVAIINFVFFLISILFSSSLESDMSFFSNESFAGNSGYRAFYVTVIIIALLTFAKKAPELLKELMPAGASKLGFGASMKDLFGLGAAVGGVAGAATGGAIGFFGGQGIGAIGGVFRGAKAGVGAKGLGAAVSGARKVQSEVNKKVAAKRANGATWLGSHIDTSRAYAKDERRISAAQEQVDMYKTASSEAESEALKNGTNYLIRSATAGGRTVSLAELDKLRNDQNLTSKERTAYEDEFVQLKKSATMFNLDYGRAVEKGSVEFKGDGSFNSMLGNSGQVYNSTDAVNAISNMDEEIGGRNATIDVNMSNLAGKATSGRGNSGKKIRNENSTFITEMKGSKSYKQHKASAGKQ